MAKFIPKKAWDKYSKIINDFVEKDAGLQPFLWLRTISGNQRYSLPHEHGEDASFQYTPIKMRGLFHYNYVKTWPYNYDTTAGTLDNTNMVLYITKNLLEEGGYLDKYGRWDFDNMSDRFILSGQVYKPAGDTSVAQANDNSLMMFVVLQMDDLEAGKKLLDIYSSNI